MGEGALREAIGTRPLSVAEVVGFAHPHSGKWGLARARQVHAARRDNAPGLCGNILAAACVAGQLYAAFPVAIVTWLVVLSALCGALFLRHWHVPQPTTPVDYRPQWRLMAEALAIGVAWAALPALFFVPADPSGRWRSQPSSRA